LSRRGVIAVVVVVAFAVLGGCASDEAGGSTEPTAAVSGPKVGEPAGRTTPAPPPRPRRLSGVRLALQPLVDLPLLTAMAANPTDGSLYFSSQTGEVWRLADVDAEPELVLDLTDVVSPWLEGSERGLLGLEFSPVDGRLFVYYTDGEVDSHLVSYAVAGDGRPKPRSRREVYFVDQPGVGHKGGGIAFEPDGTLYLALGDGGGSSGRDAQDYSKVLGGIVRIVPRANRPGYRVPTDNPYVGDGSTPPEVWAKGLRNPWGFWRDPVTGDLWMADVGDDAMEEIDRLPEGQGGLNLGWYFIEGTQVNHQGAPPDAVAPVFAYRHDQYGPAAIGGRVYRGSAIPKLAGAYVFADMSGPFFAIGAGDKTVRVDLHQPGIITGFGTMPDGELVVLTLKEGAFRLVPG
jgi:glucose/arabinose dehydrogenase